MNTRNRSSERIVIAGEEFATHSGTPFVPFGVNYFRPDTGWAPKVWQQFDPDPVGADLRRLADLGATCVRVFLTFASFYTEPGKLDPEGLAKFDRFLDLADAAGLRVHPTGPDHWEGLPAWARADRYADEPFLQALEAFWSEFVARYRGRPTIFAYDLLNEPSVPWDTPALRRAWGGAVPKPEPGATDLLDYQQLREGIGEAWTRRQTAAIKQADPDALATVGLIQWSIPSKLPTVQAYAAFRPSRIAPYLDFLEVHFYPLDPLLTYAPGEIEQNLAYLETVVREVACFGKPVVLAEFGWYGGGAFDDHPPATEEDQAAWCNAAITRTAGMAKGWLNWGFYDQPGARDVSVLTGLLRSSGELKAWGRRFEELALALPALPEGPALPADLPVLDWDACITDPAAGDAFREAYRAARGG